MLKNETVKEKEVSVYRVSTSWNLNQDYPIEVSAYSTMARYALWLCVVVGLTLILFGQTADTVSVRITIIINVTYMH